MSGDNLTLQDFIDRIVMQSIQSAEMISDMNAALQSVIYTISTLSDEARDHLHTNLNLLAQTYDPGSARKERMQRFVDAASGQGLWSTSETPLRPPLRVVRDDNEDFDPDT